MKEVNSKNSISCIDFAAQTVYKLFYSIDLLAPFWIDFELLNRVLSIGNFIHLFIPFASICKCSIKIDVAAIESNIRNC